VPTEKQPFVGKKSPDYMVFSLDQVDLDSSGEEEQKAGIKVDEKKEEKVKILEE
jgi:hypothetical protein